MRKRGEKSPYESSLWRICKLVRIVIYSCHELYGASVPDLVPYHDADRVLPRHPPDATALADGGPDQRRPPPHPQVPRAARASQSDGGLGHSGRQEEHPLRAPGPDGPGRPGGPGFSPDDRRVVRLRITPAGKSAIKKFERSLMDNIGQYLKGLDAEDRRDLVTAWSPWSGSSSGTTRPPAPSSLFEQVVPRSAPMTTFPQAHSHDVPAVVGVGGGTPGPGADDPAAVHRRGRPVEPRGPDRRRGRGRGRIQGPRGEEPLPAAGESRLVLYPDQPHQRVRLPRPGPLQVQHAGQPELPARRDAAGLHLGPDRQVRRDGPDRDGHRRGRRRPDQADARLPDRSHLLRRPVHRRGGQGRRPDARPPGQEAGDPRGALQGRPGLGLRPLPASRSR